MIEKFIRCTQCNQIAPCYGALGDFGDSPALPGVEWSTEELDRRKDFSRAHQGHSTEEIFVDAEMFISDKPSFEPHKVSYFEAGNGRERFLIRRTKNCLAEPAFYEIIPGRLRIANVSLRIQEEDLRKELAMQNGSATMNGEMAQKFIRAFQEEVESIPPEQLSAEVDLTQEGETPLLIYGSLKEDHWEGVLQRCQEDIEQNDLLTIKHFIRENRHPGDVLSLVIQRELSILTPEIA